MIAAFSTSSPWASVAVVTADGEVRWQGMREASHQAGGACLAMLAEAQKELGISVAEFDSFAADVGPGSFTGVRVGVMLAKTFAYMFGKSALSADSFDLIDPEESVVLPSKRGEYFVRRPGGAPLRTTELPEGPFCGYGSAVDSPTPPEAARFAALVARLARHSALELVPHYLIEPSISTPKVPFGSHP